MLLLLELHGDLPDHFPDDERRLYIFGCPRKSCNKKPGSIRALRAVRRVKVEQAPRKTDEKPKEYMQEKVEAPKQD
jgi:pre-rRNA-processing protein TSR4